MLITNVILVSPCAAINWEGECHATSGVMSKLAGAVVKHRERRAFSSSLGARPGTLVPGLLLLDMLGVHDFFTILQNTES